jgi:hypothetical protein
VIDLRDKLHNVHGRLFQAAMWRRYARQWDQPDHSWVEKILRVSREECLRRARINVRLARRLNRLEKLATDLAIPK